MLIFWKLVPLLISYDVICGETLHVNNFALAKGVELKHELDTQDLEVMLALIHDEAQ